VEMGSLTPDISVWIGLYLHPENSSFLGVTHIVSEDPKEYIFSMVSCGSSIVTSLKIVTHK